MSDDQIVKLLEEIRDLQREFLANQKIGLQNQHVSVRNQQESIAVQKRAVQRNKIVYVIAVVLFLYLGLSLFVPFLTWVISFALRR